MEKGTHQHSFYLLQRDLGARGFPESRKRDVESCASAACRAIRLDDDALMLLTTTRPSFHANVQLKLSDDREELCYGNSRWPSLGRLSDDVELGDTLLHLAVRAKANDEFISVLLRRPELDLTIKNAVGKTAAEVDPTVAQSYKAMIKAAAKKRMKALHD